ncbi:MAG: metallophosphoesterase family protein [Bacteroidota bacterium]|nr:metallophosphoesterase family protein [Bacteroidota bacterium]
MKVGLISDTHSYLDPKLERIFAGCDEIWHAGDWGNYDSTVPFLKNICPIIKGVYGNIDGKNIRDEFPEYICFEAERMKVSMIHIGNPRGIYTATLQNWLQADKPQIFICGHSHILKVFQDKKYKHLHMNPGAAGMHGFHHVRTVLRFEINAGKMSNLEAIELGPRTAENFPSAT